MASDEFDVAIVGFGPVGALMANLLGQAMGQLPPRDLPRQARKPLTDKIEGRTSRRVEYLRRGWVT